MVGIAPGTLRHAGDARTQRALRVGTACGFAVDVLPDRCLDLGAATYRGVPVAWRNATPLRHPADLPENTWRQRFIGGVLATCGLDNVGPPCVDRGAEFPQHGRIGGEPARAVSFGTRKLLGRRVHWICGEIAQPGSGLVLRRRIVVADEAPIIRVTDLVCNEGTAPEAVMVQYHCNFGQPLVTPGGEVVVPDSVVTPRDPHAAAAIDRWRAIEPPQAGEVERVFRHEQRDRRWSEASLLPPAGSAGWSVRVRARRRTLPWLWQWRVFATEPYVVGLEPANCAVKPRVAARTADALPVLSAGECARYGVEILFQVKE